MEIALSSSELVEQVLRHGQGTLRLYTEPLWEGQLYLDLVALVPWRGSIPWGPRVWAGSLEKAINFKALANGQERNNSKYLSLHSHSPLLPSNKCSPNVSSFDCLPGTLSESWPIGTHYGSQAPFPPRAFSSVQENVNCLSMTTAPSQ